MGPNQIIASRVVPYTILPINDTIKVMTATSKKLFFRTELLRWFAQHDRALPWKETKDAYKIWLSEIILQQTRVEQGQPYYLRFVEAFPEIADLAAAPRDQVMKLWEGLGYYSRARNLHDTAIHITENLNGKFPDRYENILKLKGVGPYTAAAIASFAFDLPRAVVDGNVYRVLSRFFGISTPIDSTEGKKAFAELAQELIDPEGPADYNQAIMDFGATHCRPKNPLCGSCPMAARCTALAERAPEEYPVKKKKLKKRRRFFHYLCLEQAGQWLLRRREAKDIWQQLHDFPLIEKEQALSLQELQRLEEWKAWVPESAEIQGCSTRFQQTLSHQKIEAVFVKIQLLGPLAEAGPPYFWQAKGQLEELAFPRIIQKFLENPQLHFYF